MSTPFYKPRFLRVFTGLVYLYLFIPIVIVIVFSFNSAKSLQVMQGVSLRWYSDFFNDPTLMDSLVTSVQIAVLTMVISTIVGTALAIGLVRAHSGTARGFNILMLVPLITPEIVAGISALLIFSQLGIGLSIWTIVIAHITFSISYVTIVVRGRLATIGVEVEDAAQDLGASKWESVRLVLVPALWPAIVAAGLLVFALSFDDFVLSFFTTGEDAQPLPVRIWSMIRFGVSPTINAVGTLMMVVSISAVALAVLIPRLFGRRESGVKVLTGAEE
ncbi:MAG TPA: ABC transporter permease [Solirubrobacterales bacterium]|nr:ABC transporter permease [Solirubrobacterales bacterium]HMY26919.1 ABC transporter permease [Solirubrobacterales bacterium]HNC94346.1 ABC transporter permease [Solirubrobacterales bacterium]HNF84865.1 ABC transporter permease [Solirubrobacterales bacterium]